MGKGKAFHNSVSQDLANQATSPAFGITGQDSSCPASNMAGATGVRLAIKQDRQ